MLDYINKKFLLLYPLTVIMVLAISTSSVSKNSTLFHNQMITDYDTLDKRPVKVIKIFMVHSYNPDHICTAPQREGFVNKLHDLEVESRENKSMKYIYRFNIRSFYMWTKLEYTTIPQIKERAKIAIQKIKEFKPDYIYTSDDNAFEYVAIPLSYKYKIFASGLNKSIQQYFNEYGTMINRKNIYAVEEIFNLNNFFLLISKAHIIINKVYLLINDPHNLPPTTAYIFENYKRILNKSMYKNNVEVIPIHNTSELAVYLTRLNSEPCGLLVPCLQNLYDTNTHRLIDKAKIVEIIVKYNKKHLELALNEEFVRFGLSIGNAPNFYDMGEIAASLLIKYLTVGKFNGCTILPPSRLCVNAERLSQLGFSRILDAVPSLIEHTYSSIEHP